MTKTYVFFNGEIIEEEKVTLSLRSKIVNYGLGVFEGIRAYWDDEGQQLYGFKLLEHYERFLQSGKAVNIDIKYTAQELVDYTVELLKKHNYKTTVYIRPLAFKNDLSIGVTLEGNEHDTVAIYCQPLDKYIEKEEFKVGVSSWTRIADNMLPPRTKATAGYMNSALANLEAIRAGFDEAVLLNRNGNVCEGPGENIFIVKNNKLITPPASDDILEGITRSLVMELAEKELGIEVVEKYCKNRVIQRSRSILFRNCNGGCSNSRSRS